jgi:hypothetical protein
MSDRLVRARPVVLFGWVLAATTVAVLWVGVATQDRYDPPDRTIEGLVLDGGPTTTGPLSSAGRPVEPIPHRQIEGDNDG